MNRCRAWLAIVALACGGGAACHANPTATLPPAATAPHFPDYVFPTIPEKLAPSGVDALHDLGWQWLQAGDPKSAERNFTAALRQSPGFYPSEAGLGYAALARKDNQEAASHFERARAVNPAYAPALPRRGARSLP